MKGKSIATGITGIVIVGIIGFMFVSGILAFDQEKLNESVKELPTSIQESIKNVPSNIEEAVQQIPSTVSNQATLASKPKNNLFTTMPNKILTEDNIYAQLVPSDVKITDKGRYNLVNLQIKIEMKNLPFDAMIGFRPQYTTLKDQKSRDYEPDKSECSFNEIVKINAKVTDTATYNICYSVDKSSNKFSIFYTEPFANYHMTKPGYFVIDTNFFEYYKQNRNPNPTQIGTIDLTK